jgi:hypothetical protein
VVFGLRGDLARAATLEGYADAALQRHGNERDFTETTTHDRLLALLHEGLARNDLTRLSEGAALTPEAAIALALRNTNQHKARLLRSKPAATATRGR